MSIVNVNGQNVDVEGFDQMSPEDQESTKQDIATQLGHHEAAQADAVKSAAEAEQNKNWAQGPMAPLAAAGGAVASAVPPVLHFAKDVVTTAGALGTPYAAYQFNQYLKQRSALEAQEAAQRMATNQVVGASNQPGTKIPVTTEPTPPSRPMGFVDTNTPPRGPMASAPVQSAQMPQMGQAQVAQGMPRPGMPAPGMPPAQPAVGGPAAQQGSTFLESIAQKYGQIAQKFAPTLQGMAESPLGRVAGGALRIAGSTPVMGAQLALHSGGLNTNEDQLLAEKHRLEAQMLMNKHAAEWSKYKNAQQATQGK